jgi:hypothetical protein
MGSVIGKETVEQPTFQVLAKKADYEIRRYSAQVAVQTRYKVGYENQAFRRLAAYIGVFQTPRNRGTATAAGPEAIAMTAPVVTTPEAIAMTAPVITTPEPIAMTAPVVTTPESGATELVMQFILPSMYNTKPVPEPTDPLVTIARIPSRTRAVMTFSGRTPEKVVRERGERLLSLVKADGIQTLTAADHRDAPYYIGRFNPPFTLPPFRRNEMYVDVDYQGPVDEMPAAAASAAAGS